MICPTCGWDNVPGNEACSHCQQDLTPFDRPTATCKFERSLMEDRASLLAKHYPVTVPATTTIQQAIATLLDRNVGALLVVDEEDRLLGILSERDVLKKIAGIRDDYRNLPVTAFMTTRPESVNACATLVFVLNKMDGGGYRHVPVVADGKPVGIISVRDMLRHLTRVCEQG
jgi:CBS domain-containing protein